MNEKNATLIDVLVALLASEQELNESVRAWMVEVLVIMKKE
ncbi:hypothetical protein [Photobacterium phosphoreum]|nr:hypothetical protein [Photobacterium phosphoreum]